MIVISDLLGSQPLSTPETSAWLLIKQFSLQGLSLLAGASGQCTGTGRSLVVPSAPPLPVA